MDQEKVKGYLFAALTALSWAISPIFIHKGLEGLTSSIWGTAVGLFVAMVIYLTWYLSQKKWKEISKPGKKAVYWQVLGGVSGGLGIMFRNIALDTTLVAVVVALAQTSALFTVILGPFMLGSDYQERISKKLVIGILALIIGTVLIIIGRYQ